MKRTLIAIALLITVVGYSQGNEDTNTYQKRNEIKLNGLMLVVGAFEVSYDYLLNEESSIGISVLVPFDEDLEDLNYYISPYYRFYFGSKFAQGFFLEGFGMLNSYDDYTIYYYGDSYSENKETTTDFALGIGLGGKWVTKRGLLGEVSFGVGRNLFNSNDNGNEIVGKIGITIGYRF